jgi:hypothetical protein
MSGDADRSGAAAMRLRPHHLLCSLGFRGLGYSPGFAANMAAILGTLRDAPETRVALVPEPDSICAAFPADQPCHCGEEAVAERDRQVLAALGMAPGESAAWWDLLRRAARAFAPPDLGVLCATCPWLPLGYCQEGLEALRGRPGAGGTRRP